jgi:hypothetical protein
MTGSNSKVLQILPKQHVSSSNVLTKCSQNASKKMRMRDFQVQCPYWREVHSQSAANTTEMFGFVSKLLPTPKKHEGFCGNIFF